MLRWPLINFLFQGIILLIILFACSSLLFASPLVKNHKHLSLVNRQFDWPEWKLPGPFNRSGLKRDIIYPSWFTGLWIVESTDLKRPGEKPIEYQARFILNSSDELVGDRSFNALSVGKAILGDQLLSVKDDPSSPNHQLAKFDEHAFLETKVIGRNQYFENEDEFFVDELVLQIFHTLEISRVKQVETLSKYQLCKSSTAAFEDLSLETICGEQWQVIYSAPGERLQAEPLKTSHFQLILRRG